MATITLYNDQPTAATYVPNIFIDDYMIHANGEYVKVYLYLLRSMTQTECSFSLSQIADHFDCTERDILRALKYWEKLNLFRLEYDENHDLSSVRFITDTMRPESPAPQMTQTDLSNRFIQAATPKQPDYSVDALRCFCEKDDVRELVFITEQYLGRTLNQTDMNTIFFWYDELHFSTELIEFLIENCVAKGHTSLHYMKKVAEDYAARQIHTVEEAKQLANQNSAIYYAVMKAFGIRGRNLVPSEINFLNTWSGKMGFSAEMISEACNRTINCIHEPSFGYANSILEKWKKQGIATLEEVRKADESFQQAQQGKRTPSSTQNRFINFKQRDNNYDELQKMIIRNSLQ